MNKDNKTSIFSYIGKILLFIILLPFNIVKSISLGVKKLMGKDINSENEKVDLSKNVIDEEIKNETLKFKSDESSDNAKEFITSKDEHRRAKEEIRKEKLRQRELQRQNKKSLLQKIKEKDVFEKNKRQDRKKQIVALDINSEDAKRSTEKIIFKYSALNPEGKIEKGSFLGYSKLDVHSYLLSEGYKVYEIKAVAKANIFNTDIALNRPMKKSILVFYLTQLSTYLKAGIPIVDSIKILSTQSKTESDKTIWKSVVYELSMGATLSEAMIRMGVIFPKLLINMIKAAEMTGDLPEVLDEQAEYYKAVEKSRKEMVNAMMYPLFVFIFAVIIIIYIIASVVPQFVSIYKNIGAELPGITKAIINVSNFVRSKYLIIILVILLIVSTFVILFKRSVSFKSNIQYMIMHIPVVGNIIIYNEMTMFSKTFATLINNNIFITDSMDILGRITDNEIYKSIIYDAVIALSKGENISVAFKDNWAFPNIAYQMIVTGEKTGQLGLMMEKVADYYNEEHLNTITRIKALIEPLMIIFLAVVVGGILLAVIIPMFSMYENIL